MFMGPYIICTVDWEELLRFPVELYLITKRVAIGK
jgi:hypothetical protein